MLQTQPQPTLAPDIASEVGRYRGNVYAYLMALLRNPDARDGDIGLRIGLQADTPAAWMYQHPGLRELRDRIRANAGNLRQEYARAAMLAAVPDAVDTMIAVANDPKARDGQRARERILEETGVLHREPAPDSASARDTMLALVEVLRASRQQQPAPQVIEGKALAAGRTEPDQP